MQDGTRIVGSEEQVTASAQYQQWLVMFRQRADNSLRLVNAVVLNKSSAIVIYPEGVIFQKIEIPFVSHNTFFFNSSVK